ncbi:hypothetical protein G9G63_09325 [Paenibacillus sp. EKM202P]|uniref:hypothetical protein n=1 Tax=unclassified Paenibacillus TaxID=185978 RepID=UPI0013EA6742|nr:MULTISPECIES: hypothetical protein [unclassified Paenibacillus]KAF6565349.1 hypothetical protein G9G63_09325 [Paenibacillus sp. EKM202P]KAF6569326.1 hypothetical protein G9G64_12770 [Paenibacillus sp. EKM207P]
MLKRKNVIIVVAAVLVLAFAIPKTVSFISQSIKESKIEDLRKEADSLTAKGKYLEATEVLKEMNAIMEGREYTRDTNPRDTFEKNIEAESGSLFNQLEFTDVKVLWNSSTGDLVGQITNNGSKGIKGYFAIYFYDDNGNITYSRDSIPIPGDGIRSGENVSFSVPVNRFEYSTYKVQDSTLMEID